MKRIVLYSAIVLFFLLIIVLVLLVGDPRSSAPANYMLRIDGPVGSEFDGQCSVEVDPGEADTTTTGIPVAGSLSGAAELISLPAGAVHIYCSVSRVTPGAAVTVTLLNNGEPLVEKQTTSPADPALVEYAAGSSLKRVWERLVYWVTTGWREKPPSTPRRPGK